MPAATLVVYSPHGARDVAEMLAGAGILVFAQYRDQKEAALRLADIAARLLILDLRDGPPPSTDEVRTLAENISQRQGYVIALLGPASNSILHQLHEIGVTHFLRAPIAADDLVETVHLALRLVQRSDAMSAGVTGELTRAAASYTWAWDRISNRVQISPGLSSLLGEPLPSTFDGLEALLRYVEPERKRMVLSSFQTIIETGQPADIRFSFFAGNVPLRELVHRIQPRLDADQRVIGLFATVEIADDPMGQGNGNGNYDPLTGLPNQIFARIQLERFMAVQGGSEPACGLVLLAIRRFDQINTAYGHKTADLLLKAVARRLRREAMAVWHGMGGEGTPGRAIPCRMSGAEFAVIISGNDVLDGGQALALRIRSAFERPFLVGGRVIHLVCRMGIAVAGPDVDDVGQLFQRAGVALGRAKTLGPNSFHVFDPADVDAPALMASLESDLHSALVNERLNLVFQPQVDIATGRIVGVETLVRWLHPVHGVVSPEVLLSLAENAEIMEQFDERILRMALTEMKSWQDSARSGLQVSVNVSAAQLRDPAFDAQVLTALDEAGVSPSRLTLEVTETGIVENLETAAHTLGRLRGHGVRIAIDDFGTGYSSLAYLKSLPLDYLKVDKQFVTDLAHQGRDRIVMHGLVELARSLGIGVVAEGVETEQQLEQLVREGCNWYQGYLCSQPLPADQLGEFTQEWNSRLGTAPQRPSRRRRS